MFFGHNSMLLEPPSLPTCRNRQFKACRFHWYQPFGCVPPKASFYEANFSQNSRVLKSKIHILVSISVFGEDSKSLLPTLGRSANLSEPWAPRKDTSRSFVQFFQTCCKTFGNFTFLLSIFHQIICSNLSSSSC